MRLVGIQGSNVVSHVAGIAGIQLLRGDVWLGNLTLAKKLTYFDFHMGQNLCSPVPHVMSASLFDTFLWDDLSSMPHTLWSFRVGCSVID